MKFVGKFILFCNCRRISYFSSKYLYAISENGSDKEKHDVERKYYELNKKNIYSLEDDFSS